MTIERIEPHSEITETSDVSSRQFSPNKSLTAKMQDLYMIWYPQSYEVGQ